MRSVAVECLSEAGRTGGVGEGALGIACFVLRSGVGGVSTCDMCQHALSANHLPDAELANGRQEAGSPHLESHEHVVQALVADLFQEPLDVWPCVPEVQTTHLAEAQHAGGVADDLIHVHGGRVTMHWRR